MHPPTRTKHTNCGRWITPLRAKAQQDRQALSRTLSGAHVHPPEHAGLDSVSQVLGRLTTFRDFDSFPPRDTGLSSVGGRGMFPRT